jgi:hypothetical protein
MLEVTGTGDYCTEMVHRLCCAICASQLASIHMTATRTSMRRRFTFPRTEADLRIDKGYAVWLTPVSIQTRVPGWMPDESVLVGAGVFREAWKPRWSGCCIVWQMVPTAG